MPSASFSDSRYRLDYSCSYVQQDKPNNRSLFRRVLNIVKVGAASGWSSNASYWSIAGPVNNPSGSFTYNFGNYSELLLYYADVWVGHNADGTLSFTTSASVSADTPLGSASIGSFWVSAPTIVNAPDAPSGQSVTRNSDIQATVSWTRNSSGNKAWSGVYIDRWSVSSQTWARVATVTGTGTSWVDDNITANNQYKYRIASYNSAGTSTYVETNTITTTPAAPKTVVAEKQANLDIVITWVNQAAYPTLVDIYDNGVKVGTTVSTGLSEWTHVGPNTAVTHTYTLKAVSGSLSSDFSAASNTVQLQAPPLAPADVMFNYPVVDVGNTMPKPVLSWRHNPVDASTQTKRRLRFRKQGTSTWTTDTIWTTNSQETTNNEVVTDLGDYFGYMPGVYEFQVMTWGAHATGSPWSNTAVITLESNPNVAIISPTPGQVVDRSRITVVWTYSQAQGRPQQRVSFVLENTLTGQVAWSGDLTGTATSYQLPYTFLDGQAYTLKLTAYSNMGVPTITQQVINFSVDYAEPLFATVDVVFNENTGTHQLTVMNPPTGEPVISNRVYRMINRSNPWYIGVASITDPSITHIDVQPGAIPGSPTFNREEWELVSEIGPNTVLLDRQGLTRGRTVYMIESVSEIPSSSLVLTWADADSPWVWIGAGTNFELTLGIPWNFGLSLAAGLVEDELFWFDGRDKPVSVTGTARSQTLNVSGTLDPTGQEGTTWEQLQEFFMTPGLKIYRDRDGRRVHGSVKSGSQARGNQNAGRAHKRNKYDVSFIVEEADNVSY